MKKTLFIVFKPLLVFGVGIAFSSLLFAQINQVDTSRKPFITPAGKPFGNIASTKIDSKGGKLRSSDGALEVIVPDNALDSEITISIQSTHNDLNENNEGSYQLEPSGITFKKPLQLIFHYTDGNENSDLKSIAWQDDGGQWHHVKNVDVDTILKTVSCRTSHFSRWSKFDKIYLSPPDGSVKVSKTVALHVLSLDDLHDRLANEVSAAAEPSTSNNDDDLLAFPHPIHYYTGEWTVNGIKNGDGEVGTVAKQGNRDATYNAPPTVPSGNPVEVSVQVYSDQQNKKLLLTSNITVIGGKYHFTYIHIDEGDGCFALVDSSSCIVNLDTEKPTITDINNYRPWSDWPNCTKACKTEWTNKESVKGMVEISGLASSVITPAAKKGGATSVYIALVPTMGNTASAIEHCKDGDHPIPSHLFPADPKYISFDIIDKDNLVIHFGGKSGPNDLVVQGHNEKTMIYMYRVN
jgi:hypothetical protein